MADHLGGKMNDCVVCLDFLINPTKILPQHCYQIWTWTEDIYKTLKILKFFIINP